MLIKDIEIEGRYFNGRKTSDGFIYLISIQRLQRRVKPTPWYRLGQTQTHINLKSVFLYDGSYNSPVFVNIFAYNLKHPNKDDFGIASIITENANTLYMSERHIYLTFIDYKRGKDFTVIHKVFVWKREIIPFADNSVRGRVNNQFSLDEHK